MTTAPTANELRELARQSKINGVQRREIELAIAVQQFLDEMPTFAPSGEPTPITAASNGDCPECARRKVAAAARVAKHRAAKVGAK